MLALTFSQLKQIFNQELPELVEIAEKKVLLLRTLRLNY
mgnify:CR=1 FL=1